MGETALKEIARLELWLFVFFAVRKCLLWVRGPAKHGRGARNTGHDGRAAAEAGGGWWRAGVCGHGTG